VREIILYPIRPETFKPVKGFQKRSDVLEFWISNKSILYVLETIYLIFRKTIVQKVAVIRLGVYDGGANCFGRAKVKGRTDTVKIVNVMIA